MTDVDTMRKAVAAAVNGGKISKTLLRQLATGSKSRNTAVINRIIAGSVSADVVATYYAALQSYLAGKVDSKPRKVDNKVDSMIAELQTTVIALRAENAALQQAVDSKVDSIRQLEAKVDNMLSTVDNEVDNAGPEVDNAGPEVDSSVDNMHGFYLVQRQAGASLQPYWYAGKRIEGRQVWVYIGKDKGAAPAKVRRWLLARYPEMLDNR